MQWAEWSEDSLDLAMRIGKAYSDAARDRNFWYRLRTKARSLDSALGKSFYATYSMSDD